MMVDLNSEVEKCVEDRSEDSDRIGERSERQPASLLS